MANVVDVANYLVHLSHTDGEPEPLSPLKLQKLLYYAQGISLAKRGMALFPDKLKAWVDGPVVPAVWHQYKMYAAAGIPSQNPASDMSIEDRMFIRQIWRTFGIYTGSALRDRTHAEAPWIDARCGIAPDDKSDVEITTEALKDFFARHKVALPDVPRPALLRKGREVFAIGDMGKILPAGF